MVELFGRYSGETSLITAYLAGVDRAVISEVPFDIERLARAAARRQARQPVQLRDGDRLRGRDASRAARWCCPARRTPTATASSAASAQLTGELIKERTGEDIIYQQIAYLMRSGSPDSLDLMVATNYAVMAADLALEGASGRMVALRSGTYTTVPICATREGVKRVDVDELYDAEQYRPKVRHVPGKPMFLY